MEGKEFEDKWKAAVTGAEVEPSESVWSSIESGLLAAENGRMKRQVVVYQRLAAASVIFAALIGAFGFYHWTRNTDNLMATSRAKPHSNAEVLSPATPSKKQQEIISDAGIISNTKITEADVKPLTEKTAEKKRMIDLRQNKTALSQPIDADPARTIAENTMDVQPMAALTSDSAHETKLPAVELVRVQKESPLMIKKKKEETLDLSGMPKQADAGEKIEKKPEQRRENLWASVGLSAGSYNPGSFSGDRTNATLNSPNYPTQQPGAVRGQPGAGNSYSAGLAIGKRLANRWVIQGGVNYLNQSSGYVSDLTATNSTQSKAFDLYNAAVSANSGVTFTNPYQINSILEFISIPVQAGYLILDRKIGLQMNTGISTDFFIRNSLQDESGQFSNYSQSAGSASPYRSVNWAGLVSTELSYKVGRQYRISLVPGIRYWFSSSLKSGATSNSYVADLGFRFRYILK